MNESLCDLCNTVHAKCSVCNTSSMLFEHSAGLFCFDCYYKNQINWQQSSTKQRYINLCYQEKGDQT